MHGSSTRTKSPISAHSSPHSVSRQTGAQVERQRRFEMKLIALAGSVLALAVTLPAQSYDDKAYSDPAYQAKVRAALAEVDKTVAAGPYKPTWDALKAYTTPAWYEDAKFGIFIHWGLYSVPAFGNEWYPREMYTEGSAEFKHHVATYGPQNKFDYKDFIPQFKAERFNATQWAELFRKAGAKYVVPVAEHHDGFPMYDCSFTDWSAAKMGPKRDIVGELALAGRKEGMHFGASSHRIEHWFFMGEGRKFDSDVRSGAYETFYGPAQLKGEDSDKSVNPDTTHMNDWLARTAESAG